MTLPVLAFIQGARMIRGVRSATSKFVIFAQVSCSPSCQPILLFNSRSGFLNKKSGFFNRKSGFFHWKLTVIAERHDCGGLGQLELVELIKQLADIEVGVRNGSVVSPIAK